MKARSPLEVFLLRLRAELRCSSFETERILDEVRDHLEESAERLCSEGATPEEAERKAVARFGSAELVARAFLEEVHSKGEAPMLLKGMIGGLALLTGSVSLLLALHGLFDSDSGALWTGVKLLSGIAVGLFAVLTLRDLRLSASAPDANRSLMALGAPSLVVLGLLTICSAIYLAMTRGDWEMYVIALGIAMVAQGLLIVLSIRGHHSTSNPMKSS
jgi:hypothetical protein